MRLRQPAVLVAASASLSLAFPFQSLKTKRQAPSGVPQYVVDYAPVVYLHSEDPYFPSDIGAQVQITSPEIDYKNISGVPSPLTLDNLDSLNALGNDSIYLTSKVDITTNPAWLNGEKPDSSGKTGDAVSCAIIVTDHGNGTVDAFYMYFYAFNWGGITLGENFGNHVGDWYDAAVSPFQSSFS